MVLGIIVVALFATNASGNQSAVDDWLEDGIFYEERGDYIEAISCYDEVLKLDYDNVDALIHIGNSLRFLGRFEEALSYYGKALDIEPNNGKALQGKSLCSGKSKG